VGGLFSTKLGKRDAWGISGGFRRSTVDLILPFVIPADADVKFTTYPTYYDGQLRLDYRATSQDRLSMLGIVSYDEISLVNRKPSDGAFPAFGNSTSFGRALATWYHEGKTLRNRAVLSVGVDKIRIVLGPTNKVDVDLVPVTVRDDVRAPWKTGQFRAGLEATAERYSVDVLAPVPRAEGEPPIKPGEQPELLYQNKFNRQYVAGYAAVDLDLSKSLRVTPGFRAEYFSRQGRGAWLPRLQLEQKFGKVIVRGAMGRYARGPDADAQGAATNLKPEIAAQYVLGIDTPLIDGATLNVSGYYTRRTDLTSTLRNAPPSSDGLPYFSTGSGRSYGGEMLARFVKGRWYAWLAYSLSRAERIDTANGKRRLTDFDTTHNATALASYQWGKWQFGGRFAVVTGRPITNVVGANFDMAADRYIPIVGPVNGDRLKTAHQLDLRVEREWKLQDWTLTGFLDVNNVYQNARVVDYSYNRDYSERTASTELIPSPSLGVRGVF
jgi:TonB dependent receptor